MWREYTINNPIPEGVFKQAYALLQSALPQTERRTFAGQKALLQNPAYRLRLRETDGKVDIFLAVWEWEGLRYGEHFAVDAALRGQGIGGEVLLEYRARDERPIVLEVEPAGSAPMAERRIGFYERLGFCLNPYAYEQPPLQNGLAFLPLMLMSWPGPLSQEEFAHIKRILYRDVYGISN